MKDTDMHALELFLRMKEQFPPSFRHRLMRRILTIFGPCQWPLLPLEEKNRFRQLAIQSEKASLENKILTPLLYGDKLFFTEVGVSRAEILGIREMYKNGILPGIHPKNSKFDKSAVDQENQDVETGTMEDEAKKETSELDLTS